MRKVVFLALGLGLPFLSACGSLDEILGFDDSAKQAEMFRVRQGQMVKDIESCSAQHAPGNGAHVTYALCVNSAFQTAMLDLSYPYPDLIATLSAERLRVAEQIDKGQISDVEGMARINDKIAEVTRIAQTRSTAFGNVPTIPAPQYFLQLVQTRI